MGIKLILVWKFPAIAKREGIKSAISINGHVFLNVFVLVRLRIAFNGAFDMLKETTVYILRRSACYYILF